MLRFRFAVGFGASSAIAVIAIAQGCATGGIVSNADSGCTSTMCGNACVDTSNDPDNCGSCGTACTSTQVCSQGKCGTSCSGGETLCAPDGGKATCATLSSDAKNCGSCGNACTSGQTCTSGKCTGGSQTCPQNETSCTGADGGPTCVNTQTDNAHCGNCTTTCIANLETCTSGACTSTCTGGQTLCIPDGGTTDAGDGGSGAHCADTQNSNADCGSCFHPCLNAQTCVAGVCKTALLGSGTASDPWHTATALANCSAYLTQIPSATDGVYTTHPNSTDIGVYCDMTNGGVTYEDFGFGQYSATYNGYTFVGTTDFANKAQFDSAFAYLYTRNGGLTNISPGTWSVSNCCIENTGGASYLGLAGASYMEPAVNQLVSCTTTYSATIIQLYLEPSGPTETSFTQSQASQATSSTTCSTGGNPGIFVKRY